MIKEIAIIGSSGKMGNWFLKYFSTFEHVKIKLYDKQQSTYVTNLKDNVQITQDFKSCVENADLVLICTPIDIIPNMITECSKMMKHNSIISEISSVKKRSFQSLKKLPSYLNPLCIHPMFGPGAKSIDGMLILLIPVRNQINELNTAKKIFHSSKLELIPNYKVHDEIIATVLGLTYYLNIVLADFLSSKNYKILKKFGGSTFLFQSLLSESILTDEPELIKSILFDNSLIKKEINSFLKQLARYQSLVDSDHSNILLKNYVSIRSRLKDVVDVEKSYNQLYKYINDIRKNSN